MFSTSDTIVAIATPAGRGGLGVIRISGPDAARVAGELVGREKPFKPRHATFAKVNVASGFSRTGDQVVITSFPAPASYTGEDVVELSAHGSPVVLSSILRRAIDAGARLAEPGEFTLRAFLNGKLDLIQAEAVADLIDAVTPLQARAAFDQLEGTLTQAIGAIERGLFDVIARLEASLDFPDEGYHFVGPAEARASLATLIGEIERLLMQSARGRLVREGAQVAIVGAPNVGKSSLFNALLNSDRAIVTAIPGTTRDMLTERADIGGLSLALIDTAGVRETTDVVEREGVSRTREALRVADLALVVLDRSRAMNDEDRTILAETASQPRVVVLNKSDLFTAAPEGRHFGAAETAAQIAADVSAEHVVEISARTGAGLDDLIAAIARVLGEGDALRDQPAVTNVRHTLLLERARAALLQAASALEGKISEEFPLLDLQEAGHALQEITGRRTSDDLLRHIFERFCIGK
ncbi:MAG: tRNA uridine-5-carboxymethylaminomethyl(34) synthesis GTPase MnmE [Vicinamibacterales bacterium]|jgi:tRNA modification GTPase